MDEDTRIFLEGVYPYFRILEKINEGFLRLIKENIDNEPCERLDILYVILSDLMRVFPIRCTYNSETKQKEYEVDIDSGILLLREYIPFILESYNEILLEAGSFELFNTIAKVRNKYTHEPHNIRFKFSLGSVKDYSVTVVYKGEVLTISTYQLIKIIIKLNSIFEDIKKLYLQKIETCDSKYKEYPCYQYIFNFTLSRFTEEYSKTL